MMRERSEREHAQLRPRGTQAKEKYYSGREAGDKITARAHRPEKPHAAPPLVSGAHLLADRASALLSLSTTMSWKLGVKSASLREFPGQNAQLTDT